MENSNLTVYNNSYDLVKDLKKKFRSYKRLIKENTEKQQRFPFVTLDKCLELDHYSLDVKHNGFNDTNDENINEISQKVDPISGSQPNKKRKTNDSVVNLSKINNENEELDFEMSDEENNTISYDKSYYNKNLNNLHSNQTNGKNGYKFTKLNAFTNKDNTTKTEGFNKYQSNNHNFNVKQDFLSFNNNISDMNFRIPKSKDKKESIESIISYANTLVKNNRRCGDAFTHLSKHLSEDQWDNCDIIEIIAKIALGIAFNNDLGSHINRLEEVVSKIKSKQYINDHFWDELIYRVDKRKSDGKYTHQLNTFLAGLYEYLVKNKINARVLCNEAVIMAYRERSSNQSINL